VVRFSGGKRRHGGAMRRAVTIRIGRLGDVCDIVTTHHPGSARSFHRSPPRGSRCRRGWPWCPRVSRGITKRDEPLPTVAKSIGAAETGPVAPSRGESRERGTPRRGCELLYVEYRDGAPRYLIPAPTPRTRLCGGRAPCGGGNITFPRHQIFAASPPIFEAFFLARARLGGVDSGAGVRWMTARFNK